MPCGPERSPARLPCPGSGRRLALAAELAGDEAVDLAGVGDALEAGARLGGIGAVPGQAVFRAGGAGVELGFALEPDRAFNTVFKLERIHVGQGNALEGAPAEQFGGDEGGLVGHCVPAMGALIGIPEGRANDLMKAQQHEGNAEQGEELKTHARVLRHGRGRHDPKHGKGGEDQAKGQAGGEEISQPDPRRRAALPKEFFAGREKIRPALRWCHA